MNKNDQKMFDARHSLIIIASIRKQSETLNLESKKKKLVKQNSFPKRRET